MTIHDNFDQFETNSPDFGLPALGDSHKTHDRKPKPSKVKSAPSLAIKSLSQIALENLIEPDPAYAKWLQIVMLRLLVRTPAANQLRLRPGYAMTAVCHFLGFANFERYSENRTLSEIIKDLSGILRSWERAHGVDVCLPNALDKNVKNLAKVVGLNTDETQVLAFAVLVHAEPTLEHCADLLGNDLSGFSIHRILGPALGVAENQMQMILDKKSTLSASGLLMIETRGRYDLKQMLDLITPTFSSRMVSYQSDIRSIVEGFVRPASGSDLDTTDFEHLSSWSKVFVQYLKTVIANHQKGGNILLYGLPGTGKSQYARVMADTLGVGMMEICQTNLAGNAVTPARRLRSYQIAQKFFRDQNTVILFDEVEEIFANDGIERTDEEATVPQKSYFNNLLENNNLPTIWIANSVRLFDPAYLRRFDVCLEMPTPPKKMREVMINKAFSNTISESLKKAIADNDRITPAILTQVARVSHWVAPADSKEYREQLVVDLTNQQLKAQGCREIAPMDSLRLAKSGFDPKVINSDVSVESILAGLSKSPAARLCVFGPPGTGKTAFGQWIAQSLAMPHMVLRCSDLRSAYVGETEKNIAKAFAQAAEEKAVLQLDEVDSFLQDRSKADRHYEIVQVNEMLMQMESFPGIFIASTNLFDNLDEASLRRFDLTVKFNFMTPQAAVTLFEKICVELDLNTPNTLLLQRVASLGNLTPGDFQQVLRRARLVQISDAHGLYMALEAALKLKKAAQSKPMGFLRAA